MIFQYNHQGEIFMKYKDDDIVKFLTEGGRCIDDYLIVLDPGQSGGILYFLHENILFFNLICNDNLYAACFNYIKSRGKIYESKAALKAARPDILI